MSEEKKEEAPKAEAPKAAPKAAAAPQQGAQEKKEKSKRISSAEKRDIQSIKRQIRNHSFKAKVTTAVRAYKEAISAGDKASLKQKLSEVYSLLDKGVKTHKFPQNKAARTKSRLSALIS